MATPQNKNSNLITSRKKNICKKEIIEQKEAIKIDK